MPKSGRKPDFKLKILDKTTDEKSEIGAGWKNDDGSISIVLNMCTTVSRDPNQVLTLFPVEFCTRKKTSP